MKLVFFLAVHLLLINGCNSTSNNIVTEKPEILYQPEDREIFEKLVIHHKVERNMTLDSMMVRIGVFFLGTPYVAHTLETEPEKLVINLREMDCTTLAENCLAIARTLKSDKPSFEKFTGELKNIRYRNGKVEGYPSRMHYFSDWIYTNAQKKLIKDISEEIAHTPCPLYVDFMSNHPKAYRQLSDSAALISVIAEQEKQISGREMYFIPEEKIAEIEDLLKDGDIAGIVTNIKGLDIQHVAVLVRKSGRMHILHASSAAEKVIISDETLEDYLNNSKSAIGIMVARPI